MSTRNFIHSNVVRVCDTPFRVEVALRKVGELLNHSEDLKYAEGCIFRSQFNLNEYRVSMLLENKVVVTNTRLVNSNLRTAVLHLFKQLDCIFGDGIIHTIYWNTDSTSEVACVIMRTYHGKLKNLGVVVFR